MFRRSFILSPALLTGSLPGAAQPNIDEFFTRFTSEWVRADPQLATSLQYFSGTEQDELDRLLTPLTTEQRNRRRDIAGRFLAELRRFDLRVLAPGQRISARVLEWQLDALARGARFENHAYIFNQGATGQPGVLVRFLSDIHPARTMRDAENYLARLALLAPTLDRAIGEARDRARRGIVPPKFIVTATIDQVQRLAAPAPSENVLVVRYGQRMSRIRTISDEDRRKFMASASQIVSTSVVPALERVSQSLREQKTTAPDEAGFSQLPAGREAYAVRLREATSTSVTPDQVHQVGLEQVARLESEMDAVLRQLGYVHGTVKERFRHADRDLAYSEREGIRDFILAEYTRIIEDAVHRAAALFDLRPKGAVKVVRVPEFAERNASASYTLGARDGSRPGQFNVPLPGPTFSRLEMRSTAYHEAVPGHHFQLALQQEDTALPRFRQNRITREGMVAFAEGWGLYAERLALDNGWYDGDLPGHLGALDAQLFRARRLVVDTGLHTKGWTRRQAIDYGIEPSEVERYVVHPGQACGYMIGELKFLELRDKAKHALGEDFSIKEFHNVVLRTGMAPLEVLEEVVNEYIGSAK